jgi:methyl-accepting chemotaxis protein
MNLQDFEAQYREAMAETLNELQTAVLLLAQVQNKISKIGSSVQNISERVEEFIADQKAE